MIERTPIHYGVLYTKVYAKETSVRRNINVSSENEKRIQLLRSVCLGLPEPVDLDYTSGLNLFLELGAAALRFLPLASDGKVLLDKTSVRLNGEMVAEIMEKYILSAGTTSDEDELLDQLRLLVANLETQRKLRNEIAHSTSQPKPRVLHVKPHN